MIGGGEGTPRGRITPRAVAPERPIALARRDSTRRRSSGGHGECRRGAIQHGRGAMRTRPGGQYSGVASAGASRGFRGDDTARLSAGRRQPRRKLVQRHQRDALTTIDSAYGTVGGGSWNHVYGTWRQSAAVSAMTPEVLERRSAAAARMSPRASVPQSAVDSTLGGRPDCLRGRWLQQPRQENEQRCGRRQLNNAGSVSLAITHSRWRLLQSNRGGSQCDRRRITTIKRAGDYSSISGGYADTIKQLATTPSFRDWQQAYTGFDLHVDMPHIPS